MRVLPVVFLWQSVEITDGDGVVSRRMAMVPLHRYDNVCKRQYAEGEEYPLVVLEARTRASHNHYFAALHDGFHNLPEKIAARFPTEEHLRKWLLIETGWAEEKEFDFEDEKSARRLGTFIRTEDDYARIQIARVQGEDKVTWKVIIRRAKSQSAAAMPKQAFEDSKKAVLELLEHMIGVGKGTLKREGGRAA